MLNDYKVCIANGGVYLINNYDHINYKTNISKDLNTSANYITYIISKEEWEIMHKGDDIEYNTNYVDIFIKYEDALFLYNTKDEDILRLFIISLINKIKNNDY